MKTKGLCWHCGLPIEGRVHYHEGACRNFNIANQAAKRHAVKRTQAAALNGGVELGKCNKDLATRLLPLVIRSHAEVGKIMGISAEASRLIELRALAKIRAALLPFKGARTGGEKVRQVTIPIPSLAD